MPADEFVFSKRIVPVQMRVAARQENCGQKSKSAAPAE